MSRARRNSPVAPRRTAAMKRLFIACSVVAIALPITLARAQGDGARITGTVTEAKTGQPVAGARVVVAEGQFGAVTSSNGNYVITLPAGKYTVRASMIGYQPKIDSVQVADGSPARLTFQLEQTITRLGEVVVTGYGTQQRRDVTGAVGSVAAEDIAQTATTNAMEAIKGRVPGVDIV